MDDTCEIRGTPADIGIEFMIRIVPVDALAFPVPTARSPFLAARPSVTIAPPFMWMNVRFNVRGAAFGFAMNEISMSMSAASILPLRTHHRRIGVRWPPLTFVVPVGASACLVMPSLGTVILSMDVGRRRLHVRPRKTWRTDCSRPVWFHVTPVGMGCRRRRTPFTIPVHYVTVHLPDSTRCVVMNDAPTHVIVFERFVTSCLRQCRWILQLRQCRLRFSTVLSQQLHSQGISRSRNLDMERHRFGQTQFRRGSKTNAKPLVNPNRRRRAIKLDVRDVA